MSKRERFFFIRILQRLTHTIKTKVIFFEIFLVLLVASSIGLVISINMRNTLTLKAHQFSRRIMNDLARSIELNYISQPATHEAVSAAYDPNEGVLHVGYYGFIISGRKPRKVSLHFGMPIPKTYLENLEQIVFNKNLTNFFLNPDTVLVKDRKSYLPAYEYYMPITVTAGKNSKRIGYIILRYNQAIIDNEIYEAIRLIVIITLITIFLSLLISVRGANRIVNPIIQLTNIVKQFSAGDMTVRSNNQDHDEIGVLARTFDEMIQSIREKLEMQKFVSNSTVKMIKRSVSEDIGASEKEKHTERSQVTMLFSDIRGFTAMSEKLDPNDVVSILNEYLDVQSNIIKKYHGDIDKFVGDEIVAVFHTQNMYANAVSAAREIQKTLREMNKKRQARGLPPIYVGIGINTGEVILGSIGSRDRMDFTVIGDNVNLTSRLCGAAGKGEIIITKSVYSRFKENKKVFIELPPLNVKGKSKPIEVYRVEY